MTSWEGKEILNSQERRARSEDCGPFATGQEFGIGSTKVDFHDYC